MTRRLGSSPAIAALAVCFAALVAAFTTLPAVISDARYPDVGSHSSLRRGVADGLLELWASGRGTYPSDLARLVDYWRVWHATKIVISSLLLLTLVLLAVGLWRRFVDADRRRRAWGWTAGVVTVLVVMAGGLLAANVQATTAPSIALLPLLPDAASGSTLGRTLASVQIGATDAASPESRSAALQLLVSDVERYHWTMVVVAGVLALLAAGTSALAWRRRGRASTPARPVCAAVGSLAAVAAVLYLLLGANSLVSALEPSDALLAVLGIS